MPEPLRSPLTVGQALHHAHAQGLDRLDARILLATALGRTSAWLLAHGHDALPPKAQARFFDWTQRRAQGEPVAYLVGEQGFHGLTLHVSPDVLIPRPDTETLVDWALELIPISPDAPFEVLDLGTGSGAIALAIQHRRPACRVTAVDASAAALAVARSNAQALRLPVENLLGHWFQPVAGRRFDLIVGNPPYIADGDRHLPALAHEPKQALTSGADGLDDLRHIASAAPDHLKPGAWLLLEHGHDQAAAVAALLTAQSLAPIRHRADLGGHVRCTGGQRTP